MQTPTPILPESEIKRLEKLAYEYADNSHDLYATTYTASSISYFAGAKAEYIASLSRQKDLEEERNIYRKALEEIKQRASYESRYFDYASVALDQYPSPSNKQQ